MIPLDAIGIYDVEPTECDFCRKERGETLPDEERSPIGFKMCLHHQEELSGAVARINAGLTR
jgi:hypothetical protein